MEESQGNERPNAGMGETPACVLPFRFLFSATLRYLLFCNYMPSSLLPSPTERCLFEALSPGGAPPRISRYFPFFLLIVSRFMTFFASFRWAAAPGSVIASTARACFRLARFCVACFCTSENAFRNAVAPAFSSINAVTSFANSTASFPWALASACPSLVALYNGDSMCGRNLSTTAWLSKVVTAAKNWKTAQRRSSPLRRAMYESR